ncbi:hypothetical protein [Enterobacter sp. SLBN-59]|uniref:hypothetical protein n=1 Tax=Enterobacter sp. SLBN-59 TaxID=2940621 RepID=UPI002169A9CF|nr:hypothetical protein [Enterobacter sp. SLBN-59]MCS3490720.1 hypothetical protein [Enterobacter sp. SLBN-59]
MNIQDKIILSERSGKLSLIREGMFLRCYEQSLFLFITNYRGDLHVSLRQFKNLDGRLVVYGGFPASQLKKYLPEAQETDWGYEIDCEIVCSERYQAWFKKTTQSLPAPEEKDDQFNKTEVSEKVFYFNCELCQFLESWSPGKFPRSVDDGFIMTVKKALNEME